MFVGFERIWENQTFGQEVLKTLNAKGQGQIQAVGQARAFLQPTTEKNIGVFVQNTTYTHAWKTRMNVVVVVQQVLAQHDFSAIIIKTKNSK